MEGDDSSRADQRSVHEEIALNAVVSMLPIDKKHVQRLRDVFNPGGDFFRVRITTNQVHTLKQFAERMIEQRADAALPSPEFSAGKIDANDRRTRSRQSGEHAERSSLECTYFQDPFRADGANDFREPVQFERHLQWPYRRIRQDEINYLMRSVLKAEINREQKKGCCPRYFAKHVLRILLRRIRKAQAMMLLQQHGSLMRLSDRLKPLRCTLVPLRLTS